MDSKDLLTKLEIDKIRQWLFSDIDLKGHRIQNAGQSVNDGDYITRGETIAGSLIDGSTIKNINASNISSGTLANARLNITKGTWTPAQSGVVLTVNSAKYWNLDILTFFECNLSWPVNADATAISVGGLPFTPSVYNGVAIGSDNSGLIVTVLVTPTAKVQLFKVGANQAINSDMSGKNIVISGFFV